MRDPIVEEIRQTRAEHAKRFSYNLNAMFEDMRKRQQARGGRVVNLPPKRISAPINGAEDKSGGRAA